MEPKVNINIVLDISGMPRPLKKEWKETLEKLGKLPNVKIIDNQALAEEMKECLTNGWSEHEKSHWEDYLEEEIKPYWPELYKFLVSFNGDKSI